jgi:hypothetical protein
MCTTHVKGLIASSLETTMQQNFDKFKYNNIRAAIFFEADGGALKEESTYQSIT